MKNILFFLCFLPLTVFTQSFPYDLSFNNVGYNMQDIDIKDFVHSVLIQPDGKIIISGVTENWGTDEADVFLIRFNTDGSLDATFGTGGKVLLNYDYEAPSYCLAKLQSDGKIVITFNTDIDLFCRRFLPDGTVDNSFGNNGVFTFPMNNRPYDNDILYARDLDLQSDGKIVITAENFTLSSFITLFRLNTNGTIDPTFGNSITTDYATSSSDMDFGSLKSIIVNDSIINISGSNNSTTYPNSVLIRQFTPDGVIDNTFGTNGRLRINDAFYNVNLYKINKNFCVSYNDLNAINKSRIELYNLNGTPINSFGQNGVLYYNFGQIETIKEDLNGRLVILASAAEVNNERPMIITRHHINGNLDSTFAQNGIYSNPLSPNHITYASDFEIMTDGSIIVTGNSQGLFNQGFDAFVAKFLLGLDVSTEAIQNSSFQPTIYPNPVQNNLILQYKLEKTSDLSIELYDINGRRIKVLSNQKESLGQHQKEWNISDLQTGIYFLHLESDDESITLKVIKE
ncbi:MAG: T9SS type A sorting domain-containing protein [Saprospiraceae bacterium]